MTFKIPQSLKHIKRRNPNHLSWQMSLRRVFSVGFWRGLCTLVCWLWRLVDARLGGRGYMFKKNNVEKMERFEPRSCSAMVGWISLQHSISIIINSNTNKIKTGCQRWQGWHRSWKPLIICNIQHQIFKLFQSLCQAVETPPNLTGTSVGPTCFYVASWSAWIFCTGGIFASSKYVGTTGSKEFRTM